ncbi:MAG TPA: hypothetical protein VG826_29820 [Pirellulales bacterium]|nr:hypothetical protein [Pirellulales bacterium]
MNNFINRRHVTLVALTCAVAVAVCINLKPVQSYFGKHIIFDSVRLVDVKEEDGVLSVWYFHAPFSIVWEDKEGVDVTETPDEIQLRFVVTEWPWLSASIDKEVNRDVIYDRKMEAFRLDVRVDHRRVVAVSRKDEKVLIWPRAEPLSGSGVYLGGLLEADNGDRNEARTGQAGAK